MEPNSLTIQRLSHLREKTKFSNAEWDKRGLILSESSKVTEMVEMTNICLDELLADLKSNSNEKQVRKTLIKGLKRFNTSHYDTEEKEFIGDEFQKIRSVLGLDISSHLNNWLYGNVLGTIIYFIKRKEVIIATHNFECTHCSLPFRVKVTSTRPGIPGTWIIAQCVQCDAYNLLSSGENAGGLKFENFTPTEILSTKDHSVEQARTRLEQLIYFKGKS